MGSVLSSITDTLQMVRSIYTTIADLASQWSTVLNRATSAPGLPVPSPTSSYWQDAPPFPDLVDIQQPVPTSADIVIIGSGITGVAIAKTLLELTASPLRIVVLEARALCSGATGRNGGHIKAAPHEVFANFRGKVGPEAAQRLTRFQRRHLEVLLEVGEGVEGSEVREVETVDLFLEGGDFEKAKKEVEEMAEWLPEEECKVWEAEEARKHFGANNTIVGAISYQAGALWPYRLVTGLWNDLLTKYPKSLTITTHTPVTAIARPSSSSPLYTITTPTTTLTAHQIIHATNAFAPQFIPSLRGSLAGMLAHMSAQTPGSDFPAHHGTRSWSIISSPGFDYITQRPDGPDGAPGDIMLGGGFFNSKDDGMDAVGVWDDARVDALPAMHIRGAMGAVFDPSWGASRVKKLWTGVIGTTGDLIPFVGRVMAEEREWVAAGFSGDGMVWAWLCGTALAVMVLGKEDEELEKGVGRPGGRLAEWFPVDEMRMDRARLRRAHISNLAKEIGR